MTQKALLSYTHMHTQIAKQKEREYKGSKGNESLFILTTDNPTLLALLRKAERNKDRKRL